MKSAHHALLFVALLSASLGAFAETPDSIHVNVPFDFSVGKQVLPAGSYAIERAWPDNPEILRIHALDKKAAAVVLSSVDDTQAGDPALFFHRYDDQFFLYEIRTGSGARKLPVSHLEETLQRAARQEADLVVAGQ